MSIFYLFGFLSHQDIRAHTESFSITWSEAKQNFLEQKKVFGHEKTSILAGFFRTFLHQHGRRDLQLKLSLVFTSD